MGFDAKGLLNQLLSSNPSASQGDRRINQPASGGLGSQLGGMGKAAAASGMLSMLMGSRRRRRKGGGGLISHGGAAALGALAYRAYNEWQNQQQRQDAGRQPRTLDRVSPEEAETHSRAVLKAVIAAAKADGHIDDQERRAIEGEFDKLGAEAEDRRWLLAELGKPLDPQEVAAAADSGEVASEMYLASRMVVDTENFMERAYLDELARCLRLDPALRQRLDREAEAGRAH